MNSLQKITASIAALMAVALVTPFNQAAADPINLVTDGDFTSGLTGWVLTGNTGYTYVEQYENGSAFHAGPVRSYGYLSQTINTVIGDVYQFSLQLANVGGPSNNF